MRTRWIRRGLWLLGFGCLWLNVLDDPPLRSGPYLQDVTTEAATVCMITAAPVSAEVVVFDEGGSVVGRVRDERCRRHALRIGGLRPGASYRYELSLDDGRREHGRLRTPPTADSAPVTFAFCGDSGDQPWWVWLQRTPILHWPSRLGWLPTRSAVTQVGAAMAESAPDFALHLGDVIYPKGLNAHYGSGFFRPFADLMRDAPVYALLGNHDVMDAGGLQCLQNFPGPRGEATGDGRCYSFAWGGVRVIVLDCNGESGKYEEGHPSASFLRDQLARSTEPWIVVASHYPMYSASRQRDRGDLRLSLEPVLAEAQVSLYLSGHDHCYQRFGPNERIPVASVVSGGGGKQLYEINRDPQVAGRAAALAKAFHWCHVTVTGASMRVRARGIDGVEIDAFELALPSGEALEQLRRHYPGRAARIDGVGR